VPRLVPWLVRVSAFFHHLAQGQADYAMKWVLWTAFFGLTVFILLTGVSVVGPTLDDNHVERRIAEHCKALGRFEADGKVWDCALSMGKPQHAL
jgi:hypothetical protein